MSATNRGTKRKEADFYQTPREAILSLIENYNIAKLNDQILEPSAGNGIIIQTLREAGIDNYIHAIEIREEEKAQLLKVANSVEITDFLEVEPSVFYDVIIGNPPFSQAQEFIEKSLSLLKPGGRLIFLLRTNFLESKKRFKWWQNKLPNRLYVLASRPSFTGKGTDATSYAWFIWEKSKFEGLDEEQEIRVI